MSTKSEITAMAQAIIEAHDGQAYYNFEQATAAIRWRIISTVLESLLKKSVPASASALTI